MHCMRGHRRLNTVKTIHSFVGNKPIVEFFFQIFNEKVKEIRTWNSIDIIMIIF